MNGSPSIYVFVSRFFVFSSFRWIWRDAIRYIYIYICLQTRHAYTYNAGKIHSHGNNQKKLVILLKRKQIRVDIFPFANCVNATSLPSCACLNELVIWRKCETRVHLEQAKKLLPTIKNCDYSQGLQNFCFVQPQLFSNTETLCVHKMERCQMAFIKINVLFSSYFLQLSFAEGVQIIAFLFAID